MCRGMSEVSRPISRDALMMHIMPAPPQSSHNRSPSSAPHMSSLAACSQHEDCGRTATRCMAEMGGTV